MSIFPDDIMYAVQNVLGDGPEFMLPNYGVNEEALVNAIAKALLSERQRTSDLIEEARKAAELTVGHKAFLAITTGDGNPYVKATFEDLDGSRSFVDGLIALRALLSKLGGGDEAE
ncbi:hypothetical protein HGP16_25245 [Rhizobium sp. P40RR-XXII]|uniref:hypothetical protein n=1 Tax=Rhizobium sp. P40RR-XXII TaxID=2726739 RepID=UPI0014568012|nr:hypothetical protein [Rhizobium sp. P40RR-XXII]NLS19848.1 hypothetical protein [Rhizobium sp. P40RR-XXII]